jgi:hypothetical protein
MSALINGQTILVDTPESTGGNKSAPFRQQPGMELVSWVIGKANPWKDQRNRGYQRLWGEYWRMWRGKWNQEDQTRQSERSRLIAPALAQAIDMTVSEVEEAIFGKEVWFDIQDDLQDQERIDAIVARDLLLEDLACVNAQDAISEAVLNAAIFGTGIVKISTSVGREERPTRDQTTYKVVPYGKERVYVTIESIRPDEFIPDPSGKTIQEMLGCAHEVRKPLHSVLEKIETGTYRKDALSLLAPFHGSDRSEIDEDDPQVMNSPTDSDEVEIIEYHGKVPLKFLNRLQEARSALDEVLEMDLSIRPDRENGDGPLVEAIVTIANEGILLRAIPNPFVMKDRSIIAFPFEKVPGRFWGRGISEKGYNPQKALDAELRARQDALGFISAPMLGVDAGRVPPGFKLEVKPGKVWVTHGNPDEVLRPISIGTLNPNTFNQTQEMERMVQMGTGAFDTASSLKSQSQSGANGAGSNSLMMGAFVKRAKKAIQQIDRNLLTPLIQKTMWRYMQFDPRRYPQDFKFNVKATLGMMAREVEQMQLTQLIGMMPEEFGRVGLVLVQGIVEMSSAPNKAQIMKAINEALQPPSEEQQRKQQELADLQFEAAKAQAQSVLLGNQKTIAEIQEILAKAQKTFHEAGVEDDKLMVQVAEIQVMMEELRAFQNQNQIALRKLIQQDRALDIKQQEVDIKRTQANKPKSST